MDPRLVLVVWLALLCLVVPIAIFRHPARFRRIERASFPPMEPWPDITALVTAIPPPIPDARPSLPKADQPVRRRPSLIFDCGDAADPAELEARLDRLRAQAASMATSPFGLTAVILLDQARTHLQAAQGTSGDEAEEALRQALAAIAGAEASIDRPRA